MADSLFRVRITNYPEGAAVPVCYPDTAHPASWVPVAGWAPPGWQPDDDYVELRGSSEFRWPSIKRLYRSMSAARKRARLIESFGATVIIEQSQPIEWPRHAPAESSLNDRSGSDQARKPGAIPTPLSLRLAYDIARSYDDPSEGRRLLDMYAKMVGTPSEFSSLLEDTLEYTANHTIGQLVFYIEHPGVLNGDSVRSWLNETAADLWSSA
jgi:hypothetical protein